MRLSHRPSSAGAITGIVTRAVMVVIAGGLLAACEVGFSDETDEAWLTADELTITEGFEAGSKGSYAAADVALGSGTWNLDDALIGTLAGDARNGTRSVRLRNAGRLTMQFDLAGGAGTVKVAHGTYGSDGGGTFGLFRSQNGGASWTQVGSSVSTGGSLTTTTFTVDRAGPIRLQLRKLDGGSNRINLDDVTITSAGGPAPQPGADAGTTPPPSQPGADVSVHTTLGLPTPASTSDWDDYLSVKAQYVISYNSDRKVPNWVSWELNSTHLGSAARQDNYRSDSTLPSGMPQAKPADYSGSDYDRGHMCPSGDRTATTSANSQTFYLSNMLPQSADNNGGPWAGLETYSRSLASSGKELFIVAGGVFAGNPPTIGAGVAVPEQTFKVVVVLDRRGQGPSAVTTSTRVIAVLMPNDDDAIDPGDSWRSFRVSVRDVEAATGYDFLADVAPGVQNVVENRVDDL